MNWELKFVAVCVGWALLSTGPAPGFQKAASSPLPAFDRRQSAPNGSDFVPEGKRAALTRMKSGRADLRVDFDAVVGTPKWVASSAGFLTGPSGKGLAPEGLAAIPANDPHRFAKVFVKQHQDLFGHGPEVLDAARVKRDHVTPHNGLRTVVWEQDLDGIPVFESSFIAHTTRNGDLVSVSSTLLPDPARAADAGTSGRAALQATPAVTAARAVALAAASVDAPVKEADVAPAGPPAGADKRRRYAATGLKGEATARLTWLPMNANAMRLCWDVVLTSRTRSEMYRLLVDARTGEVLVRRCLTEYVTNATYRVFTSDSPSPFSPGHPTPLTNQPPLVERQFVTLPALDTNASPNGWIEDGVNETRGNNVDAHTDRNDDNLPDLPRPQASPGRVFDFPMDLSQSPTTYSSAAVVQLFYLCNWIHDRLYGLGFTEAAGNFQNTNFGRGGLGNDALQADAQDGGGFNNANMSTPPDGSAPLMQMFLFNGPDPDRDGDFDAEIVLHEYAHGLSNRRVGGGVGISALQSEGLGEGWSDFYALALLSEPGDDLGGNFAKGAYATFLLDGLRENYYFGIRRYPYSTEMTKNPLTFKDIDPTQAESHPGVPRSPVIGSSASEVHNQGEVWCVMLWEARANLIAKHGFTAGNELILQLVTDGMNLSPPNPTFAQARDAILQAEQVDTGGTNQRELWQAFAKRGLGFNAMAPASDTTTGVVESFDIADDLRVSPLSGITSSGPVGGPFAPTSSILTLTNAGTNALSWTAGSTPVWLTISPMTGALATGDSAAVDVSVGLAAASLPSGIHTGAVQFTNLASGVAQTRTVTLRVGLPDYFAEQFSGDNDLAYSTFTFTPDGSASFYAACRSAATQFPTDPAGGASVPLDDDGFVMVTLPPGTNVSVYGVRSNVFFIGSNGYLTWEAGDDQYFESFADHFRLPRVAALFDDFDPESGGTISWRQLSNRVAVTYQDLPEYDTADSNTFQIELFYDGTIRMTYLRVDARDGLAGLSAGDGVPPGFMEMDLSELRACLPPLELVVPAQATEGAGLLAGQGLVRVPRPLTTNLTVLLAAAGIAGEVTVPPVVVCPAGQTNVTFDILVLDDALLDGTQPMTVTASAPGFGPAEATIRIDDNESATLQVRLPASAVEGSPAVEGTVVVSAIPARDLLIGLASSDPTEIRVPAWVGISAGQTSGVFSVTVVDDAEIDGPQSATVTAHVQNWTDGIAGITVLDNESLDLTLMLPSMVMESDGVWANRGRVRLSGTLLTNLGVALASSDVTELLVPPHAIIPAGQFTGTFDLTTVDDPEVDGSQTVTVTASAPGFGDGLASLTVLDDESPPPPSNPRPAHLAVDVAADSDLAWSDSRGDPVMNGGFESGDFSGWTRVNIGSGEFSLNDGAFDPQSLDGPLPPFAGQFSVVSDQTGPGMHTLYQDVAVPLGGVIRLHWAQRIRNHGTDFTSNQAFQVEIRDLSDTRLAVAFATQPGDPLLTEWTEQEFDLGSFAGQTVRIAFVEQDALGYFNAHVDDVRIAGGAGGDPITNEVYFGTSPTPGPAGLAGTTTNTVWPLPRLEALTTYYWQVVANRVGRSLGPVWQFTTKGVDHFEWSAVASPQVVGAPFGVTVTARDEFNTVVSNFTDRVALGGWAGTAGPTNVLLFEDDVAGHHFQTALNELGVGYQVFGNATESAFNAALTNAHPDTTLVIVDASSDPHDFSKIIPFVLAGGRAVFDYWNLDASPEVAAAFNASVAADMFAPQPVYDWGSSQLFVGLPNPVNFVETALNDDGDRLNPSADGTAVGGFASSPAADQAALIVGNAGRTILNGFVLDNAQPGSDAVQLAKNEILALVGAGAPVAITPANSGSFIGGVWTGEVTVLEPATNLHLLARDATGHRGSSRPFDVVVRNDLAVTITAAPDPVAVENFLTNRIVVVNSGPDDAIAVTVTNLLASTLTFVSAASSQGSCAETGSVIRADLGLLPGGASATVTLVTLPTTAGNITNWAFVDRAEADGYAGNNAASVITRVQTPTLSLSDVAVVEGDSGVTPAVFAVRLTPPTMHEVTVTFATSDGAAQAGNDYLATNGLLTFPPGQTNQVISVAVVGDTNAEPTETFQVSLSNPSNAVVAVVAATGTILNDEVPPVAYLRSTAGIPWGRADNEAAFTRIFGAEGWQDLRYETVSAIALFSPATTFIFMEGGDQNAGEMEAFLDANNSLMENWVSAGGRLCLNAAPNEGNGMSLGFGASLVYPDSTDAAMAAAPAHPLFHLPFDPVGTNWTGRSFGHATISGDGLLPLIVNSANNHVVLAELPYGRGRVLLGGMTMPSFHTPTNEAANLRANLIAYTASPVVTNSPPVIWQQPADQAVAAGTGAIISVVASGASPLCYQWRLDDAPLAGATNAVLALPNVQTNQAGPYTVVVTNSFGSVTSSIATLTVVPVIELGEAVDAPELAWLSGGAAPWLGETTNTHDAQDAARSGPISHSQESWLQTAVEGPGIVSFWWKVSSETCCDRLEFLIDDVGMTSIAGESNWTLVTNRIASGTHTLGWRYVKDGGISAGQDQGGLDEVSYVPDAPTPPIVTQPPDSLAVIRGATATFSVTVTGTPPLMFQWWKDPAPMQGRTNSVLTLPAVTAADAGAYFVIVTNAHGSATSAVATLTVTTLTNVVINVTDCGWYNHLGSHDPANSNYFCGSSGTNEYRNWFVFTLPALPSSPVSAELKVFTYGISIPDGSETYTLRQVATEVAALRSGGLGRTAIFNDLGDGSIYGSRDILVGESSRFISVPLNDALVADLMSASESFFALGGQISTLRPDANQHAFRSSQGLATNIQLVLWFDLDLTLRLTQPEIQADGTLGLCLGRADGRPLTPIEAARTRLWSTTNLTRPFHDWQQITPTLVLTNGLLRVDGLSVSNAPQQFFRAEQIP